MTILNYPYNFIVCDVGSKLINAYDPTSKQHNKITPDNFLNLNIPNLKDGMTIVIEDAHLRSREDDSMAHTYDIEQLKQIKLACDNRNVEILCFPQKSTPKTRKIYSLDKEDKETSFKGRHLLDFMSGKFSNNMTKKVIKSIFRESLEAILGKELNARKYFN